MHRGRAQTTLVGLAACAAVVLSACQGTDDNSGPTPNLSADEAIDTRIMTAVSDSTGTRPEELDCGDTDLSSMSEGDNAVCSATEADGSKNSVRVEYRDGAWHWRTDENHSGVVQP